MNLSRFLLMTVVGGVAILSAVATHADRPQPVSAELVAEDQAIQPGRPFWLALHLTMEDGWHTYWVNPGDAGLATTIEWNLPDGFRVGPIQWPYPSRMATPPLVSFGYEDEVLLLVQMEPPATLSPDALVTVAGRAEWVACQEICLKDGAEMQLSLPVAAQAPEADPRWADAFARTRANLPVALPEWSVRAEASDRRIIISVQSASSPMPEMTDLLLFPAEPAVIDHAADQMVTPLRDGYRLDVARSSFSTASPARLRGVLVAQPGWRGPDSPKALQIDVPLRSQAVARGTPE